MKNYTNLFNLQTLSNAFHLVGGEIHHQIAPIYNNALVSSPNPFVVSPTLSCVLQTMLDFLHDNKINPSISHPPLSPFLIDFFSLSHAFMLWRLCHLQCKHLGFLSMVLQMLHLTQCTPSTSTPSTHGNLATHVSYDLCLLSSWIFLLFFMMWMLQIWIAPIDRFCIGCNTSNINRLPAKVQIHETLNTFSCGVGSGFVLDSVVTWTCIA